MAERDVIIRIRAIDEASAVFRRVALAAGAFVSFWALKRGVMIATEAFIEAEASSVTLAAALRATGNAAGFTADDLEAYAEELMRLTTVDDDAFKSIMGIMATFRNVSGEVFKESIMLVADMSVQFGGLESGAIRLGKALNDPVLGMSALSRVGIQFSKIQKESIELFVEQGDLMSAQKIILAELVNQFGGQARAQVNSFGGAVKQLALAFGESKEKAGELIAEIDGLVTGIRIATVYIENFELVWDIMVTTAAFALVKIQEDFKHLFTGALPEMWQWFLNNWWEMLTTASSLVQTIIENILKNIWDAIVALKGWEPFEWTPLLDGFKNTIEQFPEITKRVMTEVEEILAVEALELRERLAKIVADRLAEIARIPGREPPDIKLLGEDDIVKKAVRGRGDLRAEEFRFLRFGRGEGDTQKDAIREAKKSARKAEEQRNKNTRELQRMTRRLEGAAIAITMFR